MEIALGDEGVSTKVPEPCLVCATPTTGVHFQVNCCRACAAFFRRSLKSKSSYRCQRTIGACDVTVKTPGKVICRFCRLKKCVQIGMKIQKEEAKSSPSNIPLRNDDYSTNLSVSEKAEIVERVYQTIKIIFSEKMGRTVAAAESNINLTKSFCKPLSRLLEISKPQEPLMKMKDVTKKKSNNFFQFFLIEIAKMLAQFEYFIALDFPEKMLLYRRFWQIFHILERTYHSANHFPNDDDMKICIGTDRYFDVPEVLHHLRTDSQLQDASLFILPLINKASLLLLPFKKACITIFEFAYICQICLWSCYELTELSPATQKLAEDLICRVSDDLHQYYTREMRMHNYAARQAELFKLIQIAEFIVRDKQQLIAANQIFNFIEHDFRYSSTL